ncbi:MAG: alpha-N-arabinofuranosidase [Fibrobacter sp.]|nr:alpha-N-arabinofuranosidase [Fibrobacter sp.]
MNSKLYRRRNNHVLTACAVMLAASMNVYSWSVSGTVKNNSTGAALSGVAVSVKDSTKYSTTTDASGNFKLESSVGVIKNHSIVTSTYSLKVKNNDLFITVPQNGMLELAIFNCSGRSLWSSKVTTTDKSAKLQLPSTLSHTAAYLQVKQANATKIHSLAWTSDGLHIGPSSGASQSVNQVTAAAMANPTLVFKKTDFRDTSITMSSETMTNMAVSMTPSTPDATCALPTNPKWTSSGILVNIKPDSKHNMASVKDPTIQKYNGNWLIYCTIYNKTNSTWSMQFIKFADFSQAAAQTPFFMDQVPGFSGYKCAPELFYFEPKKIWYLIWQQQPPAYSTTTTPDNPSSWSSPKQFGVSGLPSLPIDYFPIADATNFYLFFTGDDGKVYRCKTTVANFPNGFSSPVVVKSGDKSVIFEGSCHFKVKGTTNTYLHLVEGMGGTGRVYSAWTSEGIEGTWKDYRVGTNTPFAGKNNVTFPAGVTDWSDDVSHGELLRDNPNQEQIIDPCNLQFLYQGMAPGSGGAYENLPYRIGLLTLQK